MSRAIRAETRAKAKEECRRITEKIFSEKVRRWKKQWVAVVGTSIKRFKWVPISESTLSSSARRAVIKTKTNTSGLSSLKGRMFSSVDQLIEKSHEASSLDMSENHTIECSSLTREDSSSRFGPDESTLQSQPDSCRDAIYNEDSNLSACLDTDICEDSNASLSMGPALSENTMDDTAMDNDNSTMDEDNATMDNDNSTMDNDNSTMDNDDATMDNDNSTMDNSILGDFFPGSQGNFKELPKEDLNTPSCSFPSLPQLDGQDDGCDIYTRPLSVGKDQLSSHSAWWHYSSVSKESEYSNLSIEDEGEKIILELHPKMSPFTGLSENSNYGRLLIERVDSLGHAELLPYSPSKILRKISHHSDASYDESSDGVPEIPVQSRCSEESHFSPESMVYSLLDSSMLLGNSQYGCEGDSLQSPNSSESHDELVAPLKLSSERESEVPCKTDISFSNSETSSDTIENILNKSSLTKHENDASHFKTICYICDKGFKDIANLKQHLLTHSKIRPWPCKFPGCDDKFSAKHVLQKHYTLKHNIFNREEMPSLDRSVSFTFEDYLGPKYAHIAKMYNPMEVGDESLTD